jgi:hypothetical protein
MSVSVPRADEDALEEPEADTDTDVDGDAEAEAEPLGDGEKLGPIDCVAMTVSVAPTVTVVSPEGVAGKEGSCIVTVGSTDSETEDDTDGLIESDSRGVSESSDENV